MSAAEKPKVPDGIYLTVAALLNAKGHRGKNINIRDSAIKAQLRSEWREALWVQQATDDDLQDLIDKLRHAKAKEDSAPSVEAFPLELIHRGDEFMKLDLPPMEPMVEGVIYKQQLVEIHAWRGLGKTWMALHMALAISAGKPFLHWAVPKPRRALFVDGEMAAVEFQERLRAFGPVPEFFELWPSELMFQKLGRGLTINDPEQQQMFLATLQALEQAGRRPEVIIFDNLSALTMGGEENSNSDWDVMVTFLNGLRHAGYTVVFLHHDSKAGQQRGASRREDHLNVIIHLTKQDGAPEEKTVFNFEFTKYRGRKPKPLHFGCELVTDQDGRVTFAVDGVAGRSKQPKVPEQQEWVLRFIHERAVAGQPTDRKGVAAKFDISISTAKEHVQKLIKKRWASGESGPLQATQAGRDRIAALWPEVLF